MNKKGVTYKPYADKYNLKPSLWIDSVFNTNGTLQISGDTITSADACKPGFKFNKGNIKCTQDKGWHIQASGDLNGAGFKCNFDKCPPNNYPAYDEPYEVAGATIPKRGYMVKPAEVQTVSGKDVIIGGGPCTTAGCQGATNLPLETSIAASSPKYVNIGTKFSPLKLVDKWERSKEDPTSCKVLPTTLPPAWLNNHKHLTCKDINISNRFYPATTGWPRTPPGIKGAIANFGYTGLNSCT